MDSLLRSLKTTESCSESKSAGNHNQSGFWASCKAENKDETNSIAAAKRIRQSNTSKLAWNGAHEIAQKLVFSGSVNQDFEARRIKTLQACRRVGFWASHDQRIELHCRRFLGAELRVIGMRAVNARGGPLRGLVQAFLQTRAVAAWPNDFNALQSRGTRLYRRRSAGCGHPPISRMNSTIPESNRAAVTSVALTA